MKHSRRTFKSQIAKRKALSPQVQRAVGLAAAILTDTMPDMSDLETRAFAMLALPGSLKLKPKEMAKKLGVSAQWYWALRQRPTFQAKYRAAVLNALQGRLGEVVEATITSALRLGRDGAGDRRLLLEAAGIIGRDAIDNQRADQGQMPDSVLLWYYMAINFPQHLWAPGLRLRFEQGSLKPEAPETQQVLTPVSQPVDELDLMIEGKIGYPTEPKKPKSDDPEVIE
jgi:hypothetical protein